MDFWAVAERYGLPISMLMFATLALYYDWVVSGRRYREVSSQRDRLLRLALRGQHKALQAADLGEALVGRREAEGGDDDAA